MTRRQKKKHTLLCTDNLETLEEKNLSNIFEDTENPLKEKNKHVDSLKNNQEVAEEEFVDSLLQTAEIVVRKQKKRKKNEKGHPPSFMNNLEALQEKNPNNMFEFSDINLRKNNHVISFEKNLEPPTKKTHSLSQTSEIFQTEKRRKQHHVSSEKTSVLKLPENKNIKTGLRLEESHGEACVVKKKQRQEERSISSPCPTKINFPEDEHLNNQLETLEEDSAETKKKRKKKNKKKYGSPVDKNHGNLSKSGDCDPIKKHAVSHENNLDPHEERTVASLFQVVDIDQEEITEARLFKPPTEKTLDSLSQTTEIVQTEKRRKQHHVSEKSLVLELPENKTIKASLRSEESHGEACVVKKQQWLEERSISSSCPTSINFLEDEQLNNHLETLENSMEEKKKTKKKKKYESPIEKNLGNLSKSGDCDPIKKKHAAPHENNLDPHQERAITSLFQVVEIDEVETTEARLFEPTTEKTLGNLSQTTEIAQRQKRIKQHHMSSEKGLVLEVPENKIIKTGLRLEKSHGKASVVKKPQELEKRSISSPCPTNTNFPEDEHLNNQLETLEVDSAVKNKKKKKKYGSPIGKNHGNLSKSGDCDPIKKKHTVTHENNLDPHKERTVANLFQVVDIDQEEKIEARLFEPPTEKTLGSLLQTPEIVLRQKRRKQHQLSSEKSLVLELPGNKNIKPGLRSEKSHGKASVVKKPHWLDERSSTSPCTTDINFPEDGHLNSQLETLEEDSKKKKKKYRSHVDKNLKEDGHLNNQLETLEEDSTKKKKKYRSPVDKNLGNLSKCGDCDPIKKHAVSHDNYVDPHKEHTVTSLFHIVDIDDEEKTEARLFESPTEKTLCSLSQTTENVQRQKTRKQHHLSEKSDGEASVVKKQRRLEEKSISSPCPTNINFPEDEHLNSQLETLEDDSMEEKTKKKTKKYRSPVGKNHDNLSKCGDCDPTKKHHAVSRENNLYPHKECTVASLFQLVDIAEEEKPETRLFESPTEKTLDSFPQTAETIQRQWRRKQRHVSSERSLVMEFPEKKNIRTGLRLEKSCGQPSLVKKPQRLDRSINSPFPTNINFPEDEHLNNQLETVEVDSTDKKKKKYRSPVDKNLGNLSKSGDCDPIQKQHAVSHDNNLGPHEESTVASLFQIVDIEKEETTEARLFESPTEKTLDSLSQTTEIVQRQKRRKQHHVSSEKNLVLEFPDHKNIKTVLKSKESYGEASVVKKQCRLEERSISSPCATNINFPEDEHLNNQLETLEEHSKEKKKKKWKKYGSPFDKNFGNFSKSGDCDPIKKKHAVSPENRSDPHEESAVANLFQTVDIDQEEKVNARLFEPPIEKTDSLSQTKEIVQTEKRSKQHCMPSGKCLRLELPENKNSKTCLKLEESRGEACVVTKQQQLEERSISRPCRTNINFPEDEHLNNQFETLEDNSMQKKKKKKKKKYRSPIDKDLGNLSKTGDCDPIKKKHSVSHENNLDPHEKSIAARLFQIVDIDPVEKTEARLFASFENNLNLSKDDNLETAVEVAEIGAMSMDFASRKVERLKEKLTALQDKDFNDIMETDNAPQLLVQKKEVELNEFDAKGESSEISSNVSMKEERYSSLPNNIEVFEGEGSTLVLIDRQANALEGVVYMPPVGGAIKYTTRRRLLILDVNGLLADVGRFRFASHIRPIKVNGKSVYKRPFCGDFLKFCFGRFDVGIWSSAMKHNMQAVVNCLLGDMKSKLLFCWDRSKCTVTQFKTIEDRHKPLVLKELKKLWNNDMLDLPWEKGEYAHSNTLLLDDSPYKALMNPPHTAIFPYPYNVKDKNDNTLGPGGELRVYLEGLAMSDDFQQYIKEHPFGQPAITSSHPDWNFYFRVSKSQESAGSGSGLMSVT